MKITITINVDDDDRRAVGQLLKIGVGRSLAWPKFGADGLATRKQMHYFLLMVAECELENLVMESEAAEGGE